MSGVEWALAGGRRSRNAAAARQQQAAPRKRSTQPHTLRTFVRRGACVPRRGVAGEECPHPPRVESKEQPVENHGVGDVRDLRARLRIHARNNQRVVAFLDDWQRVRWEVGRWGGEAVDRIVTYRIEAFPGGARLHLVEAEEAVLPSDGLGNLVQGVRVGLLEETSAQHTTQKCWSLPSAGPGHSAVAAAQQPPPSHRSRACANRCTGIPFADRPTTLGTAACSACSRACVSSMNSWKWTRRFGPSAFKESERDETARSVLRGDRLYPLLHGGQLSGYGEES